MINLDNLSAAQTKAIETGETNNRLIGNALVKRGVMVQPQDGEKTYRLSTEYVNFRDALIGQNERDAAWDTVDFAEEKRFADAMEAEENATPTSEAWEIEQENRRIEDEKNAEIDRLRAEFEDADDERREEIRIALFHLGTVVYPAGSPQHEEFSAKLREALADPKAFDFLDTAGTVTPDREAEFAAAVDADDAQAMREILNETVPAVIVRDPNATRYEDLDKWTDERLFTKEDELTRRLRRRTLLGADRRLTENRLSRIAKEIEARGI